MTGLVAVRCPADAILKTPVMLPWLYAGPVTDARIEVLIATADEDDAGVLRVALDPAAPDGVHVFERKNLNGDAPAWLVLASVVVPQIPAILTSIRELADRHRIGSVKVGDVEIVNPTPEQVERLLTEHAPEAPGG